MVMSYSYKELSANVNSSSHEEKSKKSKDSTLLEVLLDTDNGSAAVRKASETLASKKRPVVKIRAKNFGTLSKNRSAAREKKSKQSQTNTTVLSRTANKWPTVYQYICDNEILWTICGIASIGLIAFIFACTIYQILENPKAKKKFNWDWLSFTYHHILLITITLHLPPLFLVMIGRFVIWFRQ